MVIMGIPLLGVKTRCADKSTAEHYEHTYMAAKKFSHPEKQSSFANFSLENAFEPGILPGNTITG